MPGRPKSVLTEKTCTSCDERVRRAAAYLEKATK